LSGKGEFTGGQNPANNYNLAGTSSTIMGASIPIVTAAADQSNRVFSWKEQGVGFTLNNLLIGDNIITVEATAQTFTTNAPD
jgi:hypothetical protein